MHLFELRSKVLSLGNTPINLTYGLIGLSLAYSYFSGCKITQKIPTGKISGCFFCLTGKKVHEFKVSLRLKSGFCLDLGQYISKHCIKQVWPTMRPAILVKVIVKVRVKVVVFVRIRFLGRAKRHSRARVVVFVILRADRATNL